VARRNVLTHESLLSSYSERGEEGKSKLSERRKKFRKREKISFREGGGGGKTALTIYIREKKKTR